MAGAAARSVLSLERAAFAEHLTSNLPVLLDLELRSSEINMVYVADEADGSTMIDLCLGYVPPPSGRVRFLGLDWAGCSRLERLRRRRRIGMVAQTEVWPSEMTVMEAVLLPQLYHFDNRREELVTEATLLARLFELPGLPAERRDLMSREALLRAGCVRGFFGSPELVIVLDRLLDQTPELAAPMAQAIAAVVGRGGAVMWITTAPGSQSAQFVEANQVLRLGTTGLIPMRRRR